MGQIHKGSLARLGGGHHRRIPGCRPAGGSWVLPLIDFALSDGLRFSAQASDRARQEERPGPGLEQGLKVRGR